MRPRIATRSESAANRIEIDAGNAIGEIIRVDCSHRDAAPNLEKTKPTTSRQPRALELEPVCVPRCPQLASASWLPTPGGGPIRWIRQSSLMCMVRSPRPPAGQLLKCSHLPTHDSGEIALAASPGPREESRFRRASSARTRSIAWARASASRVALGGRCLPSVNHVHVAGDIRGNAGHPTPLPRQALLDDLPWSKSAGRTLRSRASSHDLGMGQAARHGDVAQTKLLNLAFKLCAKLFLRRIAARWRRGCLPGPFGTPRGEQRGLCSSGGVRRT